MPFKRNRRWTRLWPGCTSCRSYSNVFSADLDGVVGEAALWPGDHGRLEERRSSWQQDRQWSGQQYRRTWQNYGSVQRIYANTGAKTFYWEESWLDIFFFVFEMNRRVSTCKFVAWHATDGWCDVIWPSGRHLHTINILVYSEQVVPPKLAKHDTGERFLLDCFCNIIMPLWETLAPSSYSSTSSGIIGLSLWYVAWEAFAVSYRLLFSRIRVNHKLNITYLHLPWHIVPENLTCS